MRRASVNNFGFGGTNVGDLREFSILGTNIHQAHIIMEEAIERPDGVLSEFNSALGIISSTSAMEFATTKPEHSVYLFSANDRE